MADTTRMKPRPNILHLFTDQQRFDTIAALGNPIISTPNLDRLVKAGTTFTRAYSPSPECIPARCAMITGQYPGRTGCYSNNEQMPSEDNSTFMSWLSESGYRTHGIEKCHFSPNPNAPLGFRTRVTQEERPTNRESDHYANWLHESGQEWVVEPHGIRGEMYYLPQPGPLPEALHPTHWVADHAVNFLRSESVSGEPWYLYASSIHPHPPFCPPIPWHKRYAARDMPLPFLPENSEELLSFINRFQIRYKYHDRGMNLNLIRCILRSGGCAKPKSPALCVCPRCRRPGERE